MKDLKRKETPPAAGQKQALQPKAQRKPSLREAEKALRGLETEEYIMNGIKRVDLFKGADSLVYLMEHRKMKTEEARQILQTLLENHYIVKVRSNKADKTCTMEVEYLFNINNNYIWIKEGSQVANLSIGLALVVLALSIAMYQIWPRTLKYYTQYLFYAVVFLIGLLIATSVVRLVVYGITLFTHPPGLWIFPNLFEECGILESFVPLYAFDVPAESPPKKAD